MVDNKNININMSIKICEKILETNNSINVCERDASGPVRALRSRIRKFCNQTDVKVDGTHAPPQIRRQSSCKIDDGSLWMDSEIRGSPS